MQFRVKLEGQDNDWRVPINPRHAHYNNLSPSHYRFRVIGSNNSDVWNEQGDILEFSIAPAYYQTNWFRALCVVALLILLWAAYQFRVRQLHQQFEMTLETRVGERTRIARELHDTLLQSFHGILLHFQTAINMLPQQPAEARNALQGAMRQAERAIVEGRDAIQALRSSVVETNDLALATRTLGEELAAKSNQVVFDVHVEGTPRNLHPVVRDDIFRIAAEALRNAFQHAQPRWVEVEIRYDSEQFRLRVRDDGKGIDPAVLSALGRKGHYGLPGMRERATLIGGKLDVWSKVDEGTEVETRVPASTAYEAVGRKSWLSRIYSAMEKG
jgi:signal transduction histidine kinase